MQAQFNLKNGKNRALVCYCDCQDTVANIRLFHNIKRRLDLQGAEILDLKNPRSIRDKYESLKDEGQK